eukprot:4760855-Heterocapsa_arctica.AAC.1
MQQLRALADRYPSGLSSSLVLDGSGGRFFQQLDGGDEVTFLVLPRVAGTVRVGSTMHVLDLPDVLAKIPPGR